MKEEWYIKKNKGEDFIYHCFTFNPKIQEHTFLGKEFIGMDPVEETRDLNAFERILDAGPEGFLPELVEELKNIFGEDNYEYDGYEIGENEFSLFFLIKAKLYKRLLKKVEQWSKYHEFKDLVLWEEKGYNL